MPLQISIFRKTYFTGLTWVLTGGKVRNSEEELNYLTPIPTETPGGNAFVLLTNDNKWLTNHTLNLSDTFGEHSINAVAGLSFETSLDNTVQAASLRIFCPII